MAVAGGSSAPRPAEEILASLRAGGPTLVAMSGGVDSAVVAHLLRRALGPAAVAATLVGPAVSPDERLRAETAARSIGIRRIELVADPLAVAEYRANPIDRCFYCRRLETSVLRAWGDAHGILRFVDGVHVDDLGEDRPGLRAMDAAGFEHPLAAAGWTKADVRTYARTQGLPNWDAPSDACLASRVAHGRPISADLLLRVAEAEAAVRALGFRRVRVRTDGRSARVEVDAAEVPRLRAEPTATRVGRDLGALGFAPVTLDPVGYPVRPGG